MHTRSLLLFALVPGLLFNPAPDAPYLELARPEVPPNSSTYSEDGRPALLQPTVGDAPAVNIGQPGLSFRYERTFGITEQAYPADTQHLNSPRGLFIDNSNNVYIAEDRGSRVLKFSAAGNTMLVLGTAGLCYTADYVFCSPQDIVTDGSGNVWVADGNRVVKYSPAGVFSQTLPASNAWQSGNDNTHFSNVQGIALGAGRLYVADWNNHRIQVYTLASVTPVYSTTIGVTGVAGSDNSHFNQPAGLALDSSGRLYVVDNGNGRVQRCMFSNTWTCSTLDSDLNNPRGISVDAANNVYIADGNNYRIRKCASGGTCSTLISGIDGWTADVATDSSGNVYVATSDGDGRCGTQVQQRRQPVRRVQGCASRALRGRQCPVEPAARRGRCSRRQYIRG